MRRLIEELAELDERTAWQVIQALNDYYHTRTIPADLTGEVKLTVVSVIEKRRGEDGE